MTGAGPHPILVDDPADDRLAPFSRDERGLASRADRRDDSGAGSFLAEGDLVVERALDAGCEPVTALADPADTPPVVARLLGVADVYLAGDAVRRAVTGLGRVHGVVAVFRRPARPAADDLARRSARLVVAEAVDNPANLGSIVRNAAALGWDGLVLDHTSADPLARRSLRVAMGTAFALPHARTRDLAAVLGRATADGMAVIALTPGDGSAPAVDIGSVDIGHDTRRAVLVGSERDGLSSELLGVATHRVRIPMAAGVDSLNVAAATAIACYVLR